jgi:drug/metabolite transporter (DMT)-like permease
LTDSHVKGLLLTGTGVFLISPDSLLIRLLSVDHWTVLFWRGSLMAIGLTIIVAITHSNRGIGAFRSIGRGGILVASLSGSANVCFVLGVTHSNVANVLVILSTGPLVAALFSKFIVKEPMAGYTWAAGIVVMGALALIFFGTLERGNPLGVFLALASVCLLSASLTVTRVHRTVDMTPALALSGLIAAGVAAGFALPLAVRATDVVILLLAGLFLVPVAVALLMQGPRLLPAPEVSLVLLLEMVLGTLWVWAFLGEAPSREALLSGTVIVATVGIHSVIQWRQTRVLEAAPS